MPTRIDPVEAGSAVLSDAARLTLLDAIPAAVFLIDGEANIRFSNLRTAQLLGMDRHELLGRNVLDFVVADDLDFAVELFDAGSGYAGMTMGPSRVRYLDTGGNSHWTQVWATTAPVELGIEGFIITLTDESVRDVLATAISHVAVDDDLDRTLAAIALSARAMPLCGRGVVLVEQPAEHGDAVTFRCVGDWPIDAATVDADETPWRRAVHEGVDADVDEVSAADHLPPTVKGRLIEAGIGSMFVRPIRVGDGKAVAVYVVFVGDVGAATVNQQDHLQESTRLASLAFAQTQRRTELEFAATCDALTGVPNRAAFMDRLHEEQRNVDVLFVDLDHFKAVNDTFGHDAGDEVITATAERITESIRSGDVVYRTGGDEFIVVCEAMSGEAERAALAERIVQRLMETLEFGEQRIQIGATVGIACGRGRDLAETVAAADQALYVAKERGRAGWVHATAAI